MSADKIVYAVIALGIVLRPDLALGALNVLLWFIAPGAGGVSGR